MSCELNRSTSLSEVTPDGEKPDSNCGTKLNTNNDIDELIIYTGQSSIGDDCNKIETFPRGIKEIAIYNASFGTRELAPALLSAIRSVYLKPWNVMITRSLEYNRDDVLYIIICPAGLGMKKIQMPKYYINWQLEYLNGNYNNPVYIERLRGALMNWDYSQTNIEIAKNRDNIHEIYVPPGFNEAITTLDILNGDYLYTDHGKDIDILFLGYCEAYPRRVTIRENCYKANMKIWFVSDLDLEGMKKAIRRSKICINMAAFEGFILHKIRMNVLLANQACVVSEVSIDRNSNIPYQNNGVCFVPYESIVETVWELLQHFDQRRAMALQSHRWYRNHQHWTDIVDFNKLLPSTY